MKRTVSVVFITKSGKVVLQRRTKDHPTKPGMLTLFGGHIEADETPDQTIAREISEETSLPELTLAKIAEQHVYIAEIEDTPFEVYEGAGAESLSIEEALKRDDITLSTRYALERIVYDHHLRRTTENS
jgi:8-oxo-dGTP diphosphatase